MTVSRWCATALVLLLTITGSALARQDKKDDDKRQWPEPVTTEHVVSIGDVSVPYRVTAGTTPLREETGKVRARIFSIAYERTDIEDRSSRPIAFCFNGGPGSSSVWLHMGAIGPRRVLMGEEGQQPAPPGKLVDNSYSWLDMADLVFIDPVSTGFSRAEEGVDASEFHGLDEDTKAVGEFIRLYCADHDRWLSPKYLVGESYGTTRAASLSGFLQDSLGMNLSGIVLVSPVLNFQTTSFDLGNDTAYWLFLPTYTATAWYHKRLDAELQNDLDSTLRQAREFASTEYLVALGRGDALTDAERSEIARKISRYTGLSQEFITRADLRVSIGAFTKELMRDKDRTVGRYDSRYTGIDRSGNTAGTEYDPSYAAVQGAFTAGVNSYLRSELGYKDYLNYEILTGRVGPWNFGAFRNRYPDVADTLRGAITRNPNLRVLCCGGYYDLATPFFAMEYTVSHLGLDPSLRSNISLAYYQSGHMMYLRLHDLKKFKQDAARFFASP